MIHETQVHFLRQQFMHFIITIFILYSVLSHHAAAAELLIGMIRVPILDTPERLSGLFAAVNKANEEQLSATHNFTVEVYNYPFCNASTSSCDFSATAKTNGLKDFLGNMSRFHAVMFTQFDISAEVIDKAKELGGLPVIDPNTIRATDYNTSNLFLMDHNIQTELTVLIRYMLMGHSCAKTGIVSENQNDYATLVQSAFKYGGYQAPKVLSWPSTNQAALDMFFGDTNRKCLVFLMSSASYMTFMRVVSSDSRFIPGDVKMFGWSQISTTTMRINGSSAMFRNLYYPKALPSLTDSTSLVIDYRAATSRWASSGRNNTDVAENFISGEVATGAPSTSGLLWYMRSMYGLKILASGTKSYSGGPSN